MVGDGKQISNPFSTGGGGVNFEVQVQASFVALMLAEGFAPCLPCLPIRKIKLQGRYAGYDTDDLIVFAANDDGSEQRKLLGQIKHSITISENNAVFREVIRAAWSDFTNASIFTKDKDAIALITGPLSSTDIADVRMLLEWARTSASAQEFLVEKVDTALFSSAAKKAKLQAFRKQIDTANGSAVADNDFFMFLRHFHLLGYDLDVKSGVMHAVLHSLIGRCSQENPSAVLAQIVQEVMFANQTAGTITRASLPPELREAFSKPVIQAMPKAISQAVPPSKVQDWNTSEFASALVIANLLGSWNERSGGDMTVARRLVEGPFDAWQSKIRQVLQLPGTPLTLRNGVWAVRQRGELWQALGSCVFDNHLDMLKDSTLAVLKERDPQFELESDKRFAANIYGKTLAHSRHIRKGLAESLALLGSRPEPLTNCSLHKPGTVAALTVREILRDSDWLLWGSLNDQLPLLAEAAPDEFLGAIENALLQSPCPFDALFAQEGGGITGRNYLTGLLWALESLAWDEQFLVRATVALGALATRDPGGQWMNRPANSLTAIFLPWLPQTTGTIAKRKTAVQTLLRESPDVAWKLLLSLLPGQVRASSSTHKPTWRKVLPDDWKDEFRRKDYQDQVSIYAEMAAEIARADTPKLQQLVEHLDHLPRQVFDQILDYLSSNEVTGESRAERIGVWTSLTELASKHRRFANAKWALPAEAVSKIEAVASRLAPSDIKDRNRRLFCGRDWDLYEDNGDWQQQERALEQRRQEVIKEILRPGGIDGVIRFAENVESPQQVGFSLGSIAGGEVDAVVLPSMLNAEDKRHADLAAGFVWGRYRQTGWDWVDTTILKGWSKADIGRCLSLLPFSAETWGRVDSLLAEDASEYWEKVGVNPYQAKGDLRIAIDRLIEHNRPWAAIDCLAKAIYDKLPLDKDRGVRALLAAVTSTEVYHSHDAIEIIKALQEDPGSNKEDLLKIEWAYLPLLDGHHGASPKCLETSLASNPDFFCDAIRAVYRSDKEQKSDIEPTEQQKGVAHQAWRLLHEWKRVPGTVDGDGFAGDAFKRWVEAVVVACTESGHLKMALRHIGSVLIHCPSDPGGLWMHRTIADVLNDQGYEEMRRGFTSAIHDSRGVHWVDPTGKPEKELARKYLQQAEDVETAGYQRIAIALRNVAKFYEREAERVIAEHQAETEEDE
jgi:hypothetical protein